MASIAALDLVWQRPWLALLLLLPALIWLLAARQDQAHSVWTGTLALWRDAQQAPARATPARLPPMAVRLLIGSLAAAVLALAGPALSTPRVAQTWTVVVDRSPSMYLPWSGDGGPTRLAQALERAQSMLAQVSADEDDIAWLDAAGGPPERASGPGVPRRWLSAPAAPRAEPDWAHHDEPGTLWVSDSAPDPAPRAAGWVASGGSAVAGFVSAHGSDRVEWDGERLVERTNVGSRPVIVVAPRAAGPLERVAMAWAEARGCDVAASPVRGQVLEIAVETTEDRTSGAGSVLQVRAERDGWSWEFRQDRALSFPGEVWLKNSAGELPCVAWQPGRVVLADGFYAPREPEGDLADFALSWAELFDRAALPPEGVVALRERRSAGSSAERLPQAAASSEMTTVRGSWLLGALAAVLAIAAIALRWR